MSLKENIDAIKEELTTEEKFLESVIKGETFFKKNKKLIIAVSIAIVLGVVGSMAYNYLKEQKLQKSNELYMSLLQKDDASKADELKSINPKLYELYSFQVMLKSDKIDSSVVNDKILKDLLSYEKASKEGSLEAYTKQDSLLKEFAYIQEAYSYMKKGNVKKADEVLGYVSPVSPLYQMAKSLKHYMK